MRTRLVAGAALTGMLIVSGTSAAQEEKIPKKPSQPFLVYVFTEGLKNEDVDMPKVAREVRKRVDKRKWLKAAETREEADIVIEVLTHLVNEQSQTRLIHRVNATGVGKTLVEDTYVTERHYIESRVDFSTGQQLVRGADERARGGSMKGAASNLAERIEDYCKENYWDLVGS